jgi:RHS repeat-associated protein
MSVSECEPSDHGQVRSRRRTDGRRVASACGASHFREACRDRFRSHLLRPQRLRRNSRTCFEGPFGEVIRATGPLAKANPFRFSTKYQDDETDLLYYGYRFYSPSTGRWLNRDPFAEIGFKPARNTSLNPYIRNLDMGVLSEEPSAYGFIGNSPITQVDHLGLVIYLPPSPPDPEPPDVPPDGRRPPGAKPCGDFTNKICREACDSLYASNNKMKQACYLVCNSVGGKTCNSLYAYCAHLMRHGSGNPAKACMAVYDDICFGE